MPLHKNDSINLVICSQFYSVEKAQDLFFGMLHSVLWLLIKHMVSRKIILTGETPTFVSGRSSLFPFEDAFLDDSHGDQSLSSGLSSPTRCQNGERVERYSRKVFVGGLPPDIDEGMVHALMTL